MDDALLDPPLRRIAGLFRDFAPAHLDRLDQLYADGFVFRDPFGAIRGDLPALRRHFAKLFELHHNGFEVHDGATGADGSYLRWTWTWQWRSWSHRKAVPGLSHLRFADDGRLRFHQDVFDAADGFATTPCPASAACCAPSAAASSLT